MSDGQEGDATDAGGHLSVVHLAGGRHAGGVGPGLPPGARAFFYPRGRTLLCEACGGPAAAEFEEAARLEASGASPW